MKYISNAFEKKWGGTKNLTKILSPKRAIILTKTLTRVMYFCLLLEVMMTNKYCKFQSNICNGFEKSDVVQTT